MSLTVLLVLICAPVQAIDWKPWGPEGGPASTSYEDGVQAYRSGHFDEAAKILSTLHQAQPEQVNTTYYLAMSYASQHRYEEARKFYQEVITLDPQGEAGQLAKEGLENLPPASASGLDKPPRFAQNPRQTPDAPANPNTISPAPPQGMAQALNSGNLPNGMSAQDLMMLQQVFGGGSGAGNNNNNTWAPWMSMQQQNPNDPNSMQPQLNPDLMSTMMMNQMMQNFTLDAGKRDE